MTTEEMNQKTLSLIKNIVEHGFDFIESQKIMKNMDLTLGRF